MGNVIRSLVVSVGVDLRKAQVGFKQAAREFRAAGQSLTQIGTGLTMGVTLPIIGAGVAAVKLASDMEESTNKVNVAFKDSADIVKNWSDTSLRSFGIAKGTALDMAATFGDMGTAMGLTSDQAATMSTSLAGLAGDLASFKNIGVDQASEALRGIFTGEGEALKTLGVIMQDSTLEAYALANGFTKTYKEMTQAEKVSLRYKYVMDATKNAQGDFARTSDGVANQTRIVTESIKELAAKLGTNLLPMVADAMAGINKVLDSFTSLDKQTQKNIIIFAGLAASIGPVITVIGKMSTALGGLMTGLAAATKAISAGGGLVSALTALIGPGGWITLAVVGVAALAAGIIYLATKTDDATKKYKAMAGEIEASNLAYADTQAEIESSAIAAGKMADELYALSGKADKSNVEILRMKTLVAGLNELMPGLNLQLDANTGLLSLNRQEVTKYIAEKKKELQLKAYESRYIDLYKQQADLTMALTDAQKELNAAREANSVEGIMQTGDLVGAKERVEKAEKAVAGLNGQLEANGAAIGMLDGVYNAAASSIVPANNAIQQSNQATATSTTEMTDEQKAAHDAYLQSVDTYYSELESLTETHNSQMGSLLDNGIQKTELTAAQAKRNLRKQIKDWDKWQKDLKRLAARGHTDVLAELEAMGPEMAPLIKDLADGSKEEWDDFARLWKKKAKKSRKGAQDELGKLPEEAETIGGDTATGFSAGNNDKLPNVMTAARTMGDLYKKELRRELGVASPSKETIKIGHHIGDGLVIGINGKLSSIKNAARAMAKSAMPSVGQAAIGTLSAGGVSVGRTTSSNYTLNVNGASNPEQVAGVVVGKLKMAGVIR